MKVFLYPNQLGGKFSCPVCKTNEDLPVVVSGGKQIHQKCFVEPQFLPCPKCGCTSFSVEVTSQMIVNLNSSGGVICEDTEEIERSHYTCSECEKEWALDGCILKPADSIIEQYVRSYRNETSS